MGLIPGGETMELNILAIGDVVGKSGLDALNRHLRVMKKETGAQFTVVNGENVSGVGLTPQEARDIYAAGADVITLGNHTWNRIQITNILDSDPYILRPANYGGHLPGRGFGVYDGPRGLRIGVMNLMGRLNLNSNLDSPFQYADRLLRGADYDIAVLDFHAEATSEKGAMAWYLDGRVSAVWGTHTHVPTADTQILPQGTGFVTDLGMVGPANSVLGIHPQDSINLFRNGLPRKFQEATGKCVVCGCLFTIDTNTKKCIAVKRVDIRE